MIHPGFWAVVPDEGCSKDSALWIHFHSAWPQSQHSLERLAEPKLGAASQLRLLQQWPKTSAWGGARPTESHTWPITGSMAFLPLTPTAGLPGSCAWPRASLGRGAAPQPGAGTGDTLGDRCSGSSGFTASPAGFPEPSSAHCLARLSHAFITWSNACPITEPGAGFLHGAVLTRQVCRDGLSDPVSESPFRLCGFWLSITLTDKEIKSLHRSKWFCKICSESYQPDAYIKLHLWPGVAN